MFKKLAIAGVALVFLGPSIVLLALGVLMNPAATANATCMTEGSLSVGTVPDELAVTTKDGTTFTLNRQQLTHAATIITVGSQIEGVTRDGLKIALMAALTESSLRQLSNASAYPESANYANDGDGGDHDSLGLFQMRPQSGWGTVEDLMDPNYEVRAFFGGPTGPNYPSPRGLLDIDGWEDMDLGEAAQAVEVSAYPDRYQNYEPVADAILNTLATGTTSTSSTGGSVAESSRIVFPLPKGTWVKTSPYGMRVNPVTGIYKLHSGTDYAAPDGTPILAAADGAVTVAEYSDADGGLIVINHTIDGQTIATAYIHMWQTGIHVAVGDHVSAGQHIGDVGSSGNSTGPHLHFEVRIGDTNGETTDSDAWLSEHGAENLQAADTTASSSGTGCAASSASAAPTPVSGDADALVDDPTTDGQITRRMLNVYQQALAAFPDTSWSCYSPRPGTKSAHPLGRACDITFGNTIGSYPTPAQLEAGWKVTNWMKDNASTLGVDYLIWQGKIWSPARDSEGWRTYNGGGMHDPINVTGGHYDHLHITVEDG